MPPGSSALVQADAPCYRVVVNGNCDASCCWLEVRREMLWSRGKEEKAVGEMRGQPKTWEGEEEAAQIELEEKFRT